MAELVLNTRVKILAEPGANDNGVAMSIVRDGAVTEKVKVAADQIDPLADLLKSQIRGF